MPAASILFSRLALVCCGILLSLATIAGLCGGNTLACLSVMATDGVFALGWLAGATALGAVVLRRFGVSSNNALFIATAGGLGLGIFSLLGLGFGLLGWLNRPVAIAFPAVSALLFAIDLLRRHSAIRQIDRAAIEQWLREPAGFSWLWLVSVVSLTIAAVAASLMPGLLWKPLDPHPYDVTSYHLLVPREWYEGGRIVPLGHNVFSYFPFNAEMQFLLLMHATGGPWAGMYACQYLCVGYAGLMVLGVCGSCGMGKRSTFKEVAAGASSRSPVLEYASVESWKLNVERWTFASPMLAAALASTVPWFIMLAGVAYVESALMLYTALSIAWALHAIQNQQHFLRSAVLSGIMAGLACGVKITAVPMLLLAVPTALLVVMLIRRPIELSSKRIWIGCFALGIAGSIVLSPWLVRNLIWSGNPLFPLAMHAMGQDHFTNDQVIRFTTAHSPTAAQSSVISKLQILWSDVLVHWQYGFVLLPAGLVACGLGWRKRATWLIIICGLFVLVTWIGFTHLLPRFLVMMIPIAAIAVARINWGRAWPAGIILVLAAAAIGWSFVIPELYKQSNPPPFQGQPRPALFGPDGEYLEKLLMSPELIDARDRHEQIALIGDASAFLYQVPMSQLHYRTVFNVATGTDDPIDAWIGPQVRGDPHWFLVINPMEIARLHGTYKYIPVWPNETEANLQQDFYLRGDQVPKK